MVSIHPLNCACSVLYKHFHQVTCLYELVRIRSARTGFVVNASITPESVLEVGNLISVAYSITNLSTEVGCDLAVMINAPRPAALACPSPVTSAGSDLLVLNAAHVVDTSQQNQGQKDRRRRGESPGHSALAISTTTTTARRSMAKLDPAGRIHSIAISEHSKATPGLVATQHTLHAGMCGPGATITVCVAFHALGAGSFEVTILLYLFFLRGGLRSSFAFQTATYVVCWPCISLLSISDMYGLTLLSLGLLRLANCALRITTAASPSHFITRHAKYQCPSRVGQNRLEAKDDEYILDCDCCVDGANNNLDTYMPVSELPSGLPFAKCTEHHRIR